MSEFDIIVVGSGCAGGVAADVALHAPRTITDRDLEKNPGQYHETDPETGRLQFLEINSNPMFAGFDQAAGGVLCDAMLDWLLS